jgi:transcriptional regulator with XRE-family HTH domain
MKLVLTLGDRIALLRKRKNLSPAHLGQQVGVSPDVISKYEQQEVTPSLAVLIRLADALAVSTDFLLGRTPDELDKRNIDRMLAVQAMGEHHQQLAYFLIDMLIRDEKVHQTHNP